ncbi:hypothetical protein Q670_12125 [Alcanivorax sp. P2S70]|nr:hypothetical protein Q670_12125 [Alcanivorax sp. P2S70]
MPSATDNNLKQLIIEIIEQITLRTENTIQAIDIIGSQVRNLPLILINNRLQLVIFYFYVRIQADGFCNPLWQREHIKQQRGALAKTLVRQNRNPPPFNEFTNSTTSFHPDPGQVYQYLLSRRQGDIFHIVITKKPT